VRLAYIISAYRQPDLLLRLIRRLSGGGTSFFVHVDLRSGSEVFDRVVAGSSHLPEVQLLERHNCRWGDFGHVRASLKGIDRLVGGGTDFDYAVLLTGQDYPIKQPGQIRAFFEAAEGRSFMAHFPLPTDEWTGGGLERIERWHVRVAGRHYSLPARRRVPGGLAPYGGSSYWCLARDCVEFIHDVVDADPAITRFFEHVDVPDEIFFQTVLMNSPHAAHIVNDDLRHIDWRDTNAGSPAVLGIEDLPLLKASPKLFARKFDEEVDLEVLDRIDREILGVRESGDARA
jgi:hypothetical protein